MSPWCAVACGCARRFLGYARRAAPFRAVRFTDYAVGARRAGRPARAVRSIELRGPHAATIDVPDRGIRVPILRRAAYTPSLITTVYQRVRARRCATWQMR